MEVFCKKCGILVTDGVIKCPECGNLIAATKCYLCWVKLDYLNKYTCREQDLADGRTVLVCSKCKEIYTEGIKIAKERGFEIKKPVTL